MPAVEASQGGMVVATIGEDLTIGTQGLSVCIGLVVVGGGRVGVAHVEDTLNMESVKRAVVGDGEVEKVFLCQGATTEQDVVFMQNQIMRHVLKTFSPDAASVVEVADCCFVNCRKPDVILKKPPTGNIEIVSPERQVCHYWMSIIQGSREDDGNYNLLNIDVQFDNTKELPYKIQEDEVRESVEDGSFKELALEALEMVFRAEGVEPEIAMEEWDIKLGDGALALLQKSL